MTTPTQTTSVATIPSIIKETIWHDIDRVAEAILVSATTYEPSSLANSTYKIIDDPVERRKLLKTNKIRGLYGHLDAVRNHRDIIMKDSSVMDLIRQLFKSEEISSITPLDCVFVNSYYRKLLRAQLEQEYLSKELTPGLIITNHNNTITDSAIVKTLQLLRIACKFLGLKSTIDTTPISNDKLSQSGFWSSISEKFVLLFGEDRIEPIEEIETIIEKEHYEFQVLMFLNIVFNMWSGSTIVLSGDKLILNPALFVSRLLPKLK